MTVRNIWQRIEKFNSHRPTWLRQQKYQAMAADPFSFLRGSCHLFHADWPVGSQIDLSPLIWICGDLHLENFGTYKGIDHQTAKQQRRVYFGINDFDEGTLAPVARDTTRLAVSILLVGKLIGLSKDDRLEICGEMLNIYRRTLMQGLVKTLTTAEGLVGELLQRANDRQRPEFLRKYLADVDSLQNIENKQLALDQETRSTVMAAYQAWAVRQSQPEFYNCLDIKQRIAGLGSLGVDRYLLLISGQGVNQRYLLDLKEQPAPVLELSRQTTWHSSAQRVLAVQSLMQPISPDLRGELTIKTKSFTFRELQPSQDKIKCAKLNPAELRQLAKIMGEVTAWSHLQGCGQRGAAEIAQLIANANDAQTAMILEYATSYAKQVRADWIEFTEQVGLTTP
jgi:uncharacterized protein (DUF2252 family)